MTDPAEIDVIFCDTPGELHCHYPGQHERQGAFIALDLENGSLYASYNPEIGNGIPMSVYHGQTRRYPIPPLTATAANRVLQEIKPLAFRILSDWENQWDGSNHHAVLGRDAQAAEAEIEQRLGIPEDMYQMPFDLSDLVEEIDAYDWMTGGADEPAELGITATTTDAELAGIAKKITAEAATGGDYGFTVITGLDEYLRDLRETLQAAAREDA